MAALTSSASRQRSISPLQDDERHALAWEREPDHRATVRHFDAGWAAEHGELARLLHLRVLRGRWLGGRAHRLPHGVRVAVIAIDPEMLKLRLPLLHSEPFERERYLCGRSRDVVVVIVPGEDRRPASVAAGQRPDVWPLAHALFDDGVEVQGVIARDRDPLGAHPAEHAKDV